ncbi:Nucleoside diphosphate kinase [Cinnamomum micranthum f. kanehirae]|uniref:Nucleoside diphosphate kinase n=1 Tax=Cinnamomum micranthum f. kanehirae TaxID=337451 RepID=A0A3S3QW63_9MAGN|nr:Nucleoside diphosphate kinase [Cinnamomum micranthum f. kanehirae]
MRSQIYRSVSKATKALFSVLEGRTVAAAVTTLRGKVPSLGSVHLRGDSRNPFWGWVFGALALPTAVYMLQESEARAAKLERTFIAIKPDGVQRGLITEIISRLRSSEQYVLSSEQGSVWTDRNSEEFARANSPIALTGPAAPPATAEKTAPVPQGRLIEWNRRDTI